MTFQGRISAGKGIVFALFVLLIHASHASATLPCADCNYTSPDCGDSNAYSFCAATLSVSDVQNAIDAALSEGGDVVVFLPPGTTTWVSNTRIDIDTGGAGNHLRIVGSGKDVTTIYNFQFLVPSDRRTNFVELGHLTMDGTDTVKIMVYPWDSLASMAPETDWEEIYWHDFTLKNYVTGGGYTLGPLIMWYGVVSNVDLYCEDVADPTLQDPYGITIYGDGVYSDHRGQFGTRDAFFVENSRFHNCSHSLAEFCDGFAVVRNNTFYLGMGSQLDSHGPGYNYCPFSGASSEEAYHAGAGFEVYDNTFDGNLYGMAHYGVSPRAGFGGLVYNNTCDGVSHCVRIKEEPGNCGEGSNCGEGPGETLDRVLTQTGVGCRQAIDQWWIWDNACVGSGCSKALFSIEGSPDCPGDLHQENTHYFLRAPEAGELGVAYAPFVYPHPLVSADFLQPVPPTNLRVTQ